MCPSDDSFTRRQQRYRRVAAAQRALNELGRVAGCLSVDGTKFYPNDGTPPWRAFPAHLSRRAINLPPGDQSAAPIFTVTVLGPEQRTWWGKSDCPWASIVLRPRRSKGDPLGLREKNPRGRPGEWHPWRS